MHEFQHSDGGRRKKLIVAVLQSESIKARDCDTATEEVRKIYGCDEELPKGSPNIWKFSGHVFNRCHCYYTKNVNQRTLLIEYYNWCEKGFLPYPGTWREQPNKVVEAINLITMLQHERLERERTNISNKFTAKR